MMLHLVVEGREIPISGRVAEMIRWLAFNADALNEQEKGWVQFDFNDKRLTPRDSRTHKEIIIKE